MLGKLRPGQRLVEQKLAVSLGIGQPTLREALKELEYQGVVRKVPQKGTYVATFGGKDHENALEVRLLLEALAFEKAAHKMSPEAEQELSQLIENMKDAAANLDVAGFHEADVAFHRRVWAIAGNAYLAQALEGTVFRIFIATVLDRGPELRNELLASAAGHQRMLLGLLSGNPATARKALVMDAVSYSKEHYRASVPDEAVTISASSNPATSNDNS
jgi:DNA-binding GntR family transcriptional regulator